MTDTGTVPRKHRYYCWMDLYRPFFLNGNNQIPVMCLMDTSTLQSIDIFSSIKNCDFSSAFCELIRFKTYCRNERGP